ncbi:hypothetical protein JQV19_06200 [Sulfitobacter mediterraneus]|uniref:hypothetical protein n=1 Tax=Sulfitobacter mediterraneus TaxID=83219 RepID=UPI00193A6711|nr:hypothetical protein [Sulfitobacter mediterraneus]MBM1556240.1 hypothetical protein [Sulfitobacter mediterraneus]MBM1567722.1 hypothetical protein [Sulfitobacter mediterraneus]MBM1571594.1 hypothetical protein [Sulfitobacter mediterraneus]MBM1575382.1 hypothetical protein [Sulfitobacter mediterraneus]MBM1579127.1 hypothetical protein [Sulfitobacter mediterraneus]
MVRFKRGDDPVITSPHLRRRLKNNPLKMLLKLAMVPLVPLALLWWFGSPAMLTTYKYYGSRADPVMSDCNYVALDGWHLVNPRYGTRRCPYLTLLPIDVKAFVEGLL